LTFFDDTLVITDDVVQEGSWKSLSSNKYSHTWVSVGRFSNQLFCLN